jgi:hypothetical protein
MSANKQIIANCAAARFGREPIAMACGFPVPPHWVHAIGTDNGDQGSEVWT